MAQIPGLHLTQTQNLMVTPQLRLAFSIMQASGEELSTLVAEEMQRNPLLKYAPSDDAEAERPAPDQQGQHQPPTTTAEALASVTLPSPADTPLDTDYLTESEGGGFDDGLDGESSPRLHTRGNHADHADFQPDSAESSPSLLDRLAEQLRLAGQFTDQQRLIGAHLIEHLDPAGRLGDEPENIARSLGVPVTALEDVRHAMMRFEPPGLFARSLQECLAAQLAAQNRFDPAMATLLDHLDLVAARQYPRLQSLCGVDTTDFAEMLAELRRLDPKPGFTGELAAITRIPDLVIDVSSDNRWTVRLNDDAFPRLVMDDSLEMRLRGSTRHKDRLFLQTSRTQASWLMRALQQRAITMLRVGTEIMRWQHNFPQAGLASLRPLTLRDIASAAELHESTISRATSGKYIATPRGLFELKYFFTNPVSQGTTHESVSSEAARYKIKSMIEAETADCILSDEAIVQKLRKEGIDIARRTVAKYRDALNIASSAQRKREKAASA